MDGTLIEAGALHKSFRPKDGSGDADGRANLPPTAPSTGVPTGL